MLVKILLINLLAVIWVMSGLDVYLRKAIWKWLFPGMRFRDSFLLKPLGCSWCIGTWIGLFSLGWIGVSVESVAMVVIIAYLNSLIEDILHLVKDILSTGINWLYNHLVK